MKKKIFSLFVALVATVAVQAQIISVVSPSGATSLYRTLPEAIEGAQSGSVLYLPGGGFTISDQVKITKKLTIIGVGHRANGDNVDGITTISGNLYFNQGSDGSAVMACYISGDVNIAEDGPVNDIIVKLCNINSVQVKRESVTGTFINQNYIRNSSDFAGSSANVKNNITGTISNINSGTILYNIIAKSVAWGYNNSSSSSIRYIYNSIIKGNILRTYTTGSSYIENCLCINNMTSGLASSNNTNLGDEPIVRPADMKEIFVNFNNFSISPVSDFHFKDEYKQYESQVGIYAGEGFDDSQLAPVPHIIHKDIDDKTDASGKLRVRIRVKASE